MFYEPVQEPGGEVTEQTAKLEEIKEKQARTSTNELAFRVNAPIDGYKIKRYILKGLLRDLTRRVVKERLISNQAITILKSSLNICSAFNNIFEHLS